MKTSDLIEELNNKLLNENPYILLPVYEVESSTEESEPDPELVLKSKPLLKRMFLKFKGIFCQWPGCYKLAQPGKVYCRDHIHS